MEIGEIYMFKNLRMLKSTKGVRRYQAVMQEAKITKLDFSYPTKNTVLLGLLE
jgi:hypothetical protein